MVRFNYSFCLHAPLFPDHTASADSTEVECLVACPLTDGSFQGELVVEGRC